MDDEPIRLNGKTLPPPKRLASRRQALQFIASAVSGLAAGHLCGPDLKAALLDIAASGPPEGMRANQASLQSKYRPLATGTVPKAFTRDEMAMLAELVEAIIPTTNTPGARAAGVHWYIDTVAEFEAGLHKQFSEGLKWLGEYSQATFGRPFQNLTEAQRTELLTVMSGLPAGEPGGQLFRLAKRWTINGYYQSEIGLLEELEWVGKEYVESFPGCQHADPSHRRMD